MAAGRVEVTTGDVAEMLVDEAPCWTSKYVAFESITPKEQDALLGV